MSVQRAILLDPGSSDFGRKSFNSSFLFPNRLRLKMLNCSDASGNIDAAESAELIANLRMTIANQTRDLDSLQRRCVEVDQERANERRSFQEELSQLSTQVSSLRDSLAAADEASRSRLSESEEQSSTLNSQLVLVRSELDNLKTSHAVKDREITALKEQLEAAQGTHTGASSKEGGDELENLREQLAASQLKQSDSEKEQEDLLVLLEEVTSKRKADKKRMREKGLEVSDDEDDEEEDGE